MSGSVVLRSVIMVGSATATIEPSIENMSTPITQDRKSTRLNSSHTVISYAVFCLKKKKNDKENTLDVLEQSAPQANHNVHSSALVYFTTQTYDKDGPLYQRHTNNCNSLASDRHSA